MVFGLIVCAGRQSRFKSATPKALMSVGGETILAKNKLAMAPYCDTVFTACSAENESFFPDEGKLIVTSGKGSGDSVLGALELIGVCEGDACFVLWGDALQEPAIYATMRKAFRGRAIVPCVAERKPYVQIVQGGGYRVRAVFSKYGEPVTEGWHDLGVFLFDAPSLLAHLRQFRARYMDGNGRYGMPRHGNEFEFLDVFNETGLEAEILPFPNGKDRSFNTVEEFERKFKES